MLADLYPQIRTTHIACALLSGLLFAARGLGVLMAARWPMIAPVRFGSYIIDTVLLAMGLSLVVVTRQYPFVAPWLTTKLCLLVIYIVLGTLALKRARTRLARVLSYAAAIATFLAMLSIATTRNPFGPLALLLH